MAGVQGIQGPQGASGLAGVQGIQGPQGASGLAGVQGIQGPQGPSGSAGVQGIQGPQGPSGASGLAGIQGPQGPQGPSGANGVQGAQGRQGPQGNQGAAGVVGAQGGAGSSSFINATNTTDGTTYYPVFVSTSGSDVSARVRTTATALSYVPSTGTLTVGAINSTPVMVDRGTVDTGPYLDNNAAYQGAILNGFYTASNPGSDSRSVLVFNAGGSTGPVQLEFGYSGTLRWRNWTDSTTWTSFKTIWHSSNDGSGTGLDADLLDGFQSATAATASTVVVRDTNRYVFLNYINSDTGVDENPAISQFIVTNSSDNYYRKASLAHVKSQLGITTADNLQVNSLGVGTAASGTAGQIRATNDITAFFSDARLKNFDGVIENALNKVMSINGYYFFENELAKSLGYSNDERQVGVSAQEIEKILPEIVVDAPINDNFPGADYKTVKYEKMIPLLIEAIKEQQRQIEELKSNYK